MCLGAQEAEEEEGVRGEAKGKEENPRAEERGGEEKWRLADGVGLW